MLMIGMAIRTISPTTTNLTRSPQPAARSPQPAARRPQPTEPYAVGKPILSDDLTLNFTVIYVLYNIIE